MILRRTSAWGLGLGVASSRSANWSIPAAGRTRASSNRASISAGCIPIPNRGRIPEGGPIRRLRRLDHAMRDVHRDRRAVADRVLGFAPARLRQRRQIQTGDLTGRAPGADRPALSFLTANRWHVARARARAGSRGASGYSMGPSNRPGRTSPTSACRDSRGCRVPPLDERQSGLWMPKDTDLGPISLPAGAQSATSPRPGTSSAT